MTPCSGACPVRLLHAQATCNLRLADRISCQNRFKYTHNFLQWALQPPGYKPEWHIGVRVKGNNKLVGFITGTIPAALLLHSYLLWSA